TDLEHLLAVPALELGEERNVRFDEVLAGFHLVEVLLAPDRPARMADVAGTAVPVLADALDRDRVEAHETTSVRFAALGATSRRCASLRPQSGLLSARRSRRLYMSMMCSRKRS